MEPMPGSPRTPRTAALPGTALSLVATLLAGAPADAAGTCPARPPRERGVTTVRIEAGPQYAAGWLHGVLFGTEYRALWTTPIEVEVLNLRTFAGGLVPTEKAGGKQTRGLKMEGKDGRRYRFRSTDKDINEEVLPAGLRMGFAKRILEDQNSSHHPAAPLVVPPLAEAAGIPTVRPRLVVLPDDPALGEFREEFKGRLGTIKETARVEAPATRGFEPFDEILDWEELAPRLDASPADRVDARAYLKARLLDIMVGDWDRQERQWNWGRRSDNRLWQPIPKDRDQAFSRFDGIALALARHSVPAGGGRLADYTRGDLPSAIGMMWNGRDLDRRLLAGLEQPVWAEVVAELQRDITDVVIERAVCEMPPEYHAINGPVLAGALRFHRDRLADIADAFYDALAGEVDIFATAAHEVATIQKLPSGEVEVSIATAEDPTAPYFRRRFEPSRTREVRLYLGDGNDRVVSTGRGSPKLRIIGGNGRDVLDETAGGDTRFYGDAEDQALRGPGTKADYRPWTDTLDKYGDRPLDWGKSIIPFPWANYETDIGVLLGAGVRFEGYGFRARPYRHRHTLKLEYATEVPGMRAQYEGRLQRRSSRVYGQLLGQVSEIEVVRFYGFGNEIAAPLPTAYYLIDQTQHLLNPSLVVPRGPVQLSLGALVKHSDTRRAAGRFVSVVQPYGWQDYTQVGGQLGIEYDTREPKNAARRGALLRVGGTAYPAALDVRKAFAEGHGEAAAHLPLLGPLTLSLRVGGQRIWGEYPFHEAAFLGGSRSVRGMARHRYAGDASLFGNSELRLRLGSVPAAIPGDLGIFVLADAGRTFLAGETSDRWHTGLGGGLWLAFRDGRNVVSFTTAVSEKRTGVYLKGALAF